MYQLLAVIMALNLGWNLEHTFWKLPTEMSFHTLVMAAIRELALGYCLTLTLA